MERRLNQPLTSKRKIHESADEDDEPLISNRTSFDWPRKKKRSGFISYRNPRSIGAREQQADPEDEPEDGEDGQSEEQEEEDQGSDEELEEDQESDEEEDEEEDDDDEEEEEEEEAEDDDDEGEDGQEGPNSKPSNAGDREGQGSNIVVTLTEPSLLDCPICYEPLTIPVFQCDQNGHISCSSCCTKIKNKCPSCSSPIGTSRCRAVEKFVESSSTPCQNIKYGCNTSVTYNKKTEHERTCAYMSCSCPHSGCKFVSSAKELYKHFGSDHVAREFVWDDDFLSFSINLRRMQKFIVLRHKNDGMLFVLHNVHAGVGNFVTLSCIQPSFMEGFNYYLAVKHKETTLKLRSVTKSISSREDYNPLSSPSLLYIPKGFFDSYVLGVEICIWRR